MDGGVSQIRDLLSQVKPEGTATTSLSRSIGAKEAFTDRPLIVVMLFFVDKAVGDELIALGAVMAGQRVAMVIKVHSELLERVEVVKVDGHGGYFNDIIFVVPQGLNALIALVGERVISSVWTILCGNLYCQITVIAERCCYDMKMVEKGGFIRWKFGKLH